MMAAAVGKANSVDVNLVRKALPGLTASSILGPVEIRAKDHQLERPISVVETVKSDAAAPTYRIDHVYTGADVIPPVDAACKMP
jgi:branched-chain amino acid transport system substrate-binding protein